MQHAKPNKSINNPSELHRIISTLRPNPLAILVEQPWNRQHSHRNEAKQTRCPAHSQALIHLEREQRENRPKRVPRHSVGCHRRSAVQRAIGVDKV